MSFKILALLASCSMSLIVAGCTTRYSNAPVEKYAAFPASPVQISNAQIDTEPRVLFSDGITTIMTDYKGWAEVVRYKIAESLGRLPITPSETKSLSVSINQINCGGHYVADCAVSILIETGAGYREVVNSKRHSGYPFDSAIDKALNDVAGKVVMSNPVLDYLITK